VNEAGPSNVRIMHIAYLADAPIESVNSNDSLK